MKVLKAVFAIPWLIALSVVGWLLVKRFPPSGIFITSTTFETPSAFINPFLPSERVTRPGIQPDGWIGQRITGDPTYITARVPGPYQFVEVELEFRTLRQAMLEFGAAIDADGKNLDLRPMYFAELMESQEWSRDTDGYRVTPNYQDIQAQTGIVTWNASATSPLLSDPTRVPQKTLVSLRGSHDFYLAPAGGKVEMVFGLQDSNRARGQSTAVFRVFRGQEEIAREAIGTSGSHDIKMGSVFEHRLEVHDASPGVYRVAFQADDDVFIRSIETPSTHWVVGPRLNSGDVVGYATTTMPLHVWTTSRHLVAETLHREGLQTVFFATSSFALTYTHEAVRFDRTDTIAQPVKLFAPNGDVRFIGDSWFAFQPDAFFEPQPKRLTDATELKKEGIATVLTHFERPEALSDGWYRARFQFRIAPGQDVMRFVLSAPGIMRRLGAVDIRRVQLTYRRPSLDIRGWFMLLRQEAANAWHRL